MTHCVILYITWYRTGAWSVFVKWVIEWFVLTEVFLIVCIFSQNPWLEESEYALLPDPPTASKPLIFRDWCPTSHPKSLPPCYSSAILSTIYCPRSSSPLPCCLGCTPSLSVMVISTYTLMTLLTHFYFGSLISLTSLTCTFTKH